MRLSFAEQIQNANVLLHENEVEKSIENYLEALHSATTPEQQFHLNGVLGRLYQRTKNPNKAIEAFKKAFELIERNTVLGSLADKAAVLNNIAAIQAESDRAEAIVNYKKALDIYSELVDKGETDYLPHLANTQFALAEVYAKKKEYYFAKKQYKEAIRIYEGLQDPTYFRLRASAHYQLGNMYTEEFNLFDAKVHYGKAQQLFELLIGDGDEALKPYLAAVLNNLAVTFNAMEEPKKAVQYYELALVAYQELSDLNFNIFQPYVASTFNNLGIVHSEMQHFEQAIAYMNQAVDRYNELADLKPEAYTHYLATCLHNLGLFHFELRNMEEAKDYFGQALEIRKQLAAVQPMDFDADFCATAMNLVELYQAQLENTLDFDYKTKALALLDEVENRLQKYGDDLPVIKTMKNDCKHYLDYFSGICEEDLSLHHVLRKVNHLKEQIDETIHPAEKINFQEVITQVLQDNIKKYPTNDRLQYELVLAHTNMSWLLLRLGEFKKAEQILLQATTFDIPLPALTCNLAHTYLLQDDLDKALELYSEVAQKVNAANEKYSEVITKDFEVLRRDGIDHPGFALVAERLE